MFLIMDQRQEPTQMNNDRAPEEPAARLFSIGHSNHELARFIQLLQGGAITAVADVRSSPFSQRYPQFNRPELERELAEHDITYVYLGGQLGGRPQRPSLYDQEGRVLYERVRATPEFRKGLERLSAGLEEYTIAMMCAEEDPLDCHRGLMIAPALVEQGIRPAHLRGDGSIETTAAMEERLLEVTKVGIGILDGLFAAALSTEERRQYLAEAYRLAARRRAFRLREEPSSANPGDLGDPDVLIP
jgi:hypothetical protein